jgi:muramidase (phage lysozyme)
MDADRYAEAFRLNLSLPGNVNAFIGAIRFAEGTSAPEGWRALYGWRKGRDDRLFTDLSAHPRRRFWIVTGEEVQPGEPFGPTETTTAAGALQINWPTWSDYTTWRVRQGLAPDMFDQVGQTGCGVWLLKERAHCYEDVIAGDFEVAVAKASIVWASLPGSLAGQHPRAMTEVKTAYLNCGGLVA